MARGVPPFGVERGLTKSKKRPLGLYLAGSHFGSAFVCILWAILSLFTPYALGLVQEHPPRLMVFSNELKSLSFHGNRSHVDYFRLLQRDGDNLLIGARNYVYNISLTDLTEHVSQRIEWISRQIDSDMCFSKGKSESECHNYIRVLARKSQGEFLVCGTNAYKPTCRDYSIQGDGSVSYEESSGVGRSPFDPCHNSTFVYADGNLYAGTVVDFQGMIPLVFRDPLKTDHSDYRQLNLPDFIHSFEYGEFVFLFFREAAVEYMNCGKRIFSRVARVCKSDRGIVGSTASSPWTSFLKSRLNCSVPGEFPFYFDEIQSVSDVVLGNYGGRQNEVIYAIFTTPRNSIPGSAVCSFSMRDVLDAFEGPFLEQKDINSNWMPVPQRLVPEPRPGRCVNDSRTLPQETINFVRSHPLMGDLVSPFHGEPILVKASFNYKFTKLAIDPQIRAVNGDLIDVIFIATNTGVILKVINAPVSEAKRQASPVVIEEIHIFDSAASINNLQIARPEAINGEPKLVIITDDEVKTVPLHRCWKASSCSDCVGLQDPYCAWSPNLGLCAPVSEIGRDSSLLQNVSSGHHRLCPKDGETNLLNKWRDDTRHQTQTPSSVPPTTTLTGGSCPPCNCAEGHSIQSTSPLPSIHSTTSIILSRPTPLDLENDSVNEVLRNVMGQDSLNEENVILPEYPEMRANDVPVDPEPRYRPRSGYSVEEFSSSRATSPVGTAGPVVGASVSGALIYSAETLAIAVTTACVAALVIGFISGFLFSRKCRFEDFPHLTETPYLDSKLNKCDNIADPNMYTANNVSLATASMPPKQINNLLVANYNNHKNINAAMANCSINDHMVTMKQAKCAYI